MISDSSEGCRVYNRQVLADIVQTAQAERQAEDARRLAANNTNRVAESASSSPTHRPHRDNGFQGSPLLNRGHTFSPLSFKSKTQKVMGKMQDARAKDQRLIKEKVERDKEFRERRFERLLRSVTGEDMYIRSDVTELLRINDAERRKKSADAYQEWNSRVYDPIQRQLDRILNPVNRALVQSLSGVKNVDFTLPEVDPIIRSNNFRNNPTYSQLNQYHQELSFRRKMDQLQSISASVSCPSKRRRAQSVDLDQLKDNIDYDSFDVNELSAHVTNLLTEETCRDPRIARSKPVLEPEQWSQLKLQATPYGHFAQVCAEGPGAKTSVKMGNHAPPEFDGIQAAGKRKTRWLRNDLGILKGEIANRGETIQFKHNLGGSSGAPGQDHFTYVQTQKVTDAEFPLGKRMYAHKH